eukprot:tig00000254_g22475.t1
MKAVRKLRGKQNDGSRSTPELAPLSRNLQVLASVSVSSASSLPDVPPSFGQLKSIKPPAHGPSRALAAAARPAAVPEGPGGGSSGEEEEDGYSRRVEELRQQILSIRPRGPLASKGPPTPSPPASAETLRQSDLYRMAAFDLIPASQPGKAAAAAPAAAPPQRSPGPARGADGSVTARRAAVPPPRFSDAVGTPEQPASAPAGPAVLRFRKVPAADRVRLDLAALPEWRSDPESESVDEHLAAMYPSVRGGGGMEPRGGALLLHVGYADASDPRWSQDKLEALAAAAAAAEGSRGLRTFEVSDGELGAMRGLLAGNGRLVDPAGSAVELAGVPLRPSFLAPLYHRASLRQWDAAGPRPRPRPRPRLAAAPRRPPPRLELRAAAFRARSRGSGCEQLGA